MKSKTGSETIQKNKGKKQKEKAKVKKDFRGL